MPWNRRTLWQSGLRILCADPLSQKLASRPFEVAKTIYPLHAAETINFSRMTSAPAMDSSASTRFASRTSVTASLRFSRAPSRVSAACSRPAIPLQMLYIFRRLHENGRQMNRQGCQWYQQSSLVELCSSLHHLNSADNCRIHGCSRDLSQQRAGIRGGEVGFHQFEGFGLQSPKHAAGFDSSVPRRLDIDVAVANH